MSPFLIVGLGNPGREYRNTRHNVGWMALDVLAERNKVLFLRKQGPALLAEFRLGLEKVIMVKPQTYMNLSGNAVRPLVSFYNVPLSQVLVVGDDLDLPVGSLRVRASGSSGGQKGLRHICEQLGTQEIPRLRVGIDRPSSGRDPADYVLHPFSKEQQEIMDVVLREVTDAIEYFVQNGVDATMQKFNGKK
ncbi:MAG TPA: aminoacyl-tRNA hydrolase [Anaerolineales bacterium]|nr:aminoacyl-tRNA hydrolase [Anaerolineales bacterium]